MSFVAVAIGGSAVVGAVGSAVAGSRAADAAESGAASAADATIISTEMQLEEIARQFDYQQQILLPQIQQQYNAQGAFADLLGIARTTPTAAGGPPPGAGAAPGTQPAGNATIGIPPGTQSEMIPSDFDPSALRPGVFAPGTRFEPDLRVPPTTSRGPGSFTPPPASTPDPSMQAARTRPADTGAGLPQFPGAGATQFARGPNGEFLDPNMDPTRLADINTLGDTVRGNLMAPTGPEGDAYRNFVMGNRMAAPTAAQDAQVRRAGDVTMMGARGGDSLEARRAGASLAASRAGVSLMDQRGNVLNAEGPLAEDEFRRDVAGRSLAEGAAGVGVYGETFQESPGYAFAVEEMNRATDRLRSRGGNIGGRAIMEAQRRAQGLANQEFYNYARGRTMDLQRLAGAEAADAARLDTAGLNFLQRRQLDIGRGDAFAREDIARGDRFAEVDIRRGDQFAGTDMARRDQFAGTDLSRGDRALAAYEAQRLGDVSRDDAAFQDFLRRRQVDATRLDAAAGQEDALLASDQARRDQAYLNYLANLRSMAGFGGGPAATAVNASQAAGAQTAGALGRQGSTLANINQNLGRTQAQIGAQTVAGVTNAITGGVENYVTFRNSRPPPAPALPPTGSPVPFSVGPGTRFA